MLKADARQHDAAPMEGVLTQLHTAQKQWASTSIKHRLTIIKKFRHALADDAEQIAERIELPQRNFLAEHLAADILPVADACRFLERNAKRILATRGTRLRDRPAWGLGQRVNVARDPLGVVLIIGTWNYPLLLTGVQLLQALVAGNAVLLKPGDGTSKLTKYFVDLLVTSGLPADLIHMLPEDPTECQQAMAIDGTGGVNKAVFTGSIGTGKKVLAQLAETATPSVMELSGSDAMFILPGADLDRVAKCIVFGLRLNGSSTCIAPRRIFVPKQVLEDLKKRLAKILPADLAAPVHPKAGEMAADLVTSAIQVGANRLTSAECSEWKVGDAFPATVLEFADGHDLDSAELLKKDVFVPVTSLIPVRDVEEALKLDGLCPYALGATVFGPTQAAEAIAKRVDAGCVVVNDMVAPTADPRVPFGGRHASGFGMTRGAEGLLEMTQVKAIITQTSSFLPHLDEPIEELGPVLLGFLKMNHGATWSQRWQAMTGLASTGRAYMAAMKAKLKKKS